MNILTINAEDWYNGNISPLDKDWERFEYRVEKMLMPMLDELDKYQVKAMVFCTGWLAEKHPETIREIARRGHKIGCNGYWHIEPMAMSIEEFREDTQKAKLVLEEVSGQQINAFRAANFSMNDERLSVLEELGFVYDFSMFGNKPYAMGKLTEYPVAKYKGMIPLSGGGFFRLMPYWMIKKAMKEMDYVMTYFHPRDFDVDQPRWDGLSIKDRFLSYAGVKGAFRKYQKMLNDFNFDTV